ncbi:MAG TPA: hypothetical protein DET40_03620 [Lentisphaeria bacterium]|nr:MAG: hypothetical protein A2X45_23460 [Lentisphaerae bacterium GWF2_50_93]HCE42618.1 hypothetical protein [Lentisphaeria bacterium]
MTEDNDAEIDEEKKNLKRTRRNFILIFLLVTGLFCMIALSLLLILPSTEKLKGAPANSDSAAKMYGIGYYLIYYSVKHNEFFPENLSELYKTGLIKGLDTFDSNELPGKVSNVEDIDSGLDFKYLIAGRKVKISDEKLAVLAENKEDGITMYICKKEISFDFKRKPESINKDMKSDEQKNTSSADNSGK